VGASVRAALVLQLLATVMVAVLVSGCVSVSDPDTWRPSDSQMHAEYGQCLRHGGEEVTLP
jgi:hypothetical protein